MRGEEGWSAGEVAGFVGIHPIRVSQESTERPSQRRISSVGGILSQSSR